MRLGSRFLFTTIMLTFRPHARPSAARWDGSCAGPQVDRRESESPCAGTETFSENKKDSARGLNESSVVGGTET